MIILVITRIIISLSVTILTCTNPFSIAITILLTALMTSRLYAALHSSWLRFLLFLIYVGGILVIFSYFLAITPNQQKFNNYSTLIPITSILLFIVILITTTDSWTLHIPILPSLTTTIFNTHNISTLIILVLILLFTIIVVIKTCKLEKGPLRSFIRIYV
jgi:NADH-ubiquinone oxidoreductase chain 6